MAERWGRSFISFAFTYDHAPPYASIHHPTAAYARDAPRHSLVAAARIEGPTCAKVCPSNSSTLGAAAVVCSDSSGGGEEEVEVAAALCRCRRRSNSLARMNMLSTPTARMRKGTTCFWFEIT